MNDLKYPLSYEYDSLCITKTNSEKSLSHVRHFTEVIKGERKLFLDFGMPLDILYNTEIPEVLISRLKLQLNQIDSFQKSVSLLDYSNGKLTLEVKIYSDTTPLELTVTV